MRRVAIVLALSLTLSACGGKTIWDDIRTIGADVNLVTASITNPVTPTMLYDAENGFIVIASGLVVYKRACIAKQIDQMCRNIIPIIQKYTRQAKPLLVQLRAFVRNNDQVNALSAYNTLVNIVNAIKAQKAVVGMT